MRCWVLTALLLQCVGWPSAQAIDLTTREVSLDGQEVVHTVNVIGAPSISTSLVFPDSFQAHSASCGDCIHVQPGEMDAPLASPSRQTGNWLVEKHPERRTIIVKPAVLPSAGNPVAGFKTNLVVGLDNGHVVNVVLTLVDLRGSTRSTADAVVHMTLPKQATVAGLLGVERQRMRADFDAEVEETAGRLFLDRLLGDVKCRHTSSKPHRSDRTVVRVRQLCTSASERRMFWCLFEIQNRSASELHIDNVELDPETGGRALAETTHFRLVKSSLAFNESTTGIVFCSLEEGVSAPSSWRLNVTPSSPDRDPIRVDKLVF